MTCHLAGASLHMCMTPHGPDTQTFEDAIAEEGEQRPAHLPRDTLAFMFEVNYTPRVMPAASALPQLDRDYYKCWEGLKSHFRPPGAPSTRAASANGTMDAAGDAHQASNGLSSHPTAFPIEANGTMTSA